MITEAQIVATCRFLPVTSRRERSTSLKLHRQQSHSQTPQHTPFNVSRRNSDVKVQFTPGSWIPDFVQRSQNFQQAQTRLMRWAAFNRYAIQHKVMQNIVGQDVCRRSSYCRTFLESALHLMAGRFPIAWLGFTHKQWSVYAWAKLNLASLSLACDKRKSLKFLGVRQVPETRAFQWQFCCKHLVADQQVQCFLQ